MSRRGRARRSRAPLDEAGQKPKRGPRITLTCDCGERRELRYGERWRCEKCGRTWDTRRIPPEEYAAVRRVRRRFVEIPAVILVAVVATVILLAVFGRVYAFILLPLTLMVWSMYGRPVHRRRLRRALDRLP